MHAIPEQEKASENRSFLQKDWSKSSMPGGFTLTSVGDLFITEPVYSRLQRISPDVVKLLQDADVTFGNFEGTVLDLSTFDGYPAALSGGGWLLMSPKVPGDLKTMGFNLVSRANNHATDYGIAGMQSTDRFLSQAGIVHAGSGKTLTAARAPQILSIAAGRVSLTSVTSRYEADSRASDAFGQFSGRPGINALRTTRYVMVAPEEFAALAKIRDSQPAGSVRQSLLESDRKTETVTLFGTHYRVQKKQEKELTFSFAMNENDRREIMTAIRQGKQISDFSIISVHTHEPGNYSAEPPDFLPVLAREAIDNGADAFIAHGPHQLRGIEIYRKKPIFYSLGNFFFMYNSWQPLTYEEYDMVSVKPGLLTEAEFLEKKRSEGVFKDSKWFESVVATSHFDEQGNLREIKIQPVELHWDSSRDADRGIPRIAPLDTANRILKRLQELSKPYGTEIVVQNGIGTIFLF